MASVQRFFWGQAEGGIPTLAHMLLDCDDLLLALSARDAAEAEARFVVGAHAGLGAAPGRLASESQLLSEGAAQQVWRALAQRQCHFCSHLHPTRGHARNVRLSGSRPPPRAAARGAPVARPLPSCWRCWPNQPRSVTCCAGGEGAETRRPGAARNACFDFVLALMQCDLLRDLPIRTAALAPLR